MGLRKNISSLHVPHNKHTAACVPEKIEIPSEVVLPLDVTRHSANASAPCVSVGDYVRVGHGMVMESYPGQTYISKIALLEDGDINSFTDEEWSRLSDVFVDGLER